MRAYKVFLIVKAGRNTDQCGLFFETAIDRRGTILQVTSAGRGVMRVQRQTESALDTTWDDNRKDHIGWVMEEKFAQIWAVVRRVPPPGKTALGCRTAREWTERVLQMLQARGVMENSRESEATVHQGESEEEEETEEEDGETREEQRRPVQDTRRLRQQIFVTREEPESEVSEEE